MAHLTMSELGRFAYAQVRLQARYGQLPDLAVWRRLESITALSHLLQTARGTGLRPWLLTIASGTRWDAGGASTATAPLTIALQGDSHGMEQSLRRQLRQHIDEVARWLPPPWRPALRWCAVLPDLPALQHLLSDSGPPAWLRDDEQLKPYAHDLHALRVQALQESRYAPLLDGGDRTTDLAARWTVQWRALWPTAASRDERAALDALARLLAAYYANLRAGHGADSARLRDQLDLRLRAGFRRHPHQGATAFYYLALTGLSLERLRGLLARLILFPLERAS